MAKPSYDLIAVGHVESTLTDRAQAPKQAHEGAPSAWLVFEPDLAEAVDDIKPGDRILVLTWLHQADREQLKVHPRGDETKPLTGVFSTRSPDRPNPIGLHAVTVTAKEGLRVQVDQLEAIDGTPVVDVKPEI